VDALFEALAITAPRNGSSCIFFLTKETAMRYRLVIGLGALLVILWSAGQVAAAPDRVTLKIEGLTPTGCSSPAAVRGTMKSTDGVSDAEVSLERGEAVLEFDPAKVDLAQLTGKVERFCQVKITRPPAP